MSTSLTHLVTRFFDVLGAKPLSDDEEEWVRSKLGNDLSPIFFEQQGADQRHGYEAAHFVARTNRVTSDLIAAAALHDIGKRHAHLGVLGRSVASALAILGLPLTARMRRYLDHDAIGSLELENLNAPPVAVDFTRYHHGDRPDSIPQNQWDVLIAADQPPKAQKYAEPPIPSADV